MHRTTCLKAICTQVLLRISNLVPLWFLRRKRILDSSLLDFVCNISRWASRASFAPLGCLGSFWDCPFEPNMSQLNSLGSYAMWSWWCAQTQGKKCLSVWNTKSHVKQKQQTESIFAAKKMFSFFSSQKQFLQWNHRAVVSKGKFFRKKKCPAVCVLTQFTGQSVHFHESQMGPYLHSRCSKPQQCSPEWAPRLSWM